MKILTKSLILTAALTLTEWAFSQSVNPPVNPGNTAGNQTMNGINPRQPEPGPAVSDRDKVSCLSDQQAVIQGDRIICMGRSQPSSEPVVPRPNTVN